MLAIKKLSSSSGHYYLDQSQRGEEFSPERPGEKPGVWMGTGAPTFGLGSTVYPQELRDLLQGFGEDHDRRLVQNAGHPTRVSGWDLTFSAPKTVSVLWAVSSPEVRREIEQRHEQAVRKALGYLESVSVLRRGQGGKNQERAGLIVAAFEHSANRNGEPCLHSHCVAVNLGIGKKHTGALHSPFLYEHKMVAGAIYRAELATGLERSLGLTVVRKQSWFEVQGIDRYPSLIKAWSSRRETIKQQKPRNAAHAQAISDVTRPRKELMRSRADRFAKWQQEAAQHGLTPQKVERLLAPGYTRSKLNQAFQSWCAVRAARKNLTQRQSHFSRADVVRAIALEAPGRGLDADALLKLSDRYLESRQVLALSHDRFTTKRTWKMEQSMLQNVERLSLTRAGRVKERFIRQVEQQFRLTEEQQVALGQLCDRRALSVLDGTTGSGKTQTLAAAAHAYRSNGYSVLAVCSSQQEAVKLAQTTQIGATSLRDEQSLSITQLFSRLDWARSKHRSSPLHRDSVVLVDNAERLSTFQLNRLLQEARVARAKVVLVGSSQSMQAIEQGGAFRGIVEWVRDQGQAIAQLTDSLRQGREQERQIIEQLQDGKAMTALRTLAQSGRLRVHQEREDAARSLVSAWATRHDGDVRHHLLIADSKEDACLVNHLAQASQTMAGHLKGQPLRVGNLELHEGERIKFTQGDRLNGITQGDLGTVTKVSRFKHSLTVKLDRGGTHRTINPYKTPGLELGYAVTTHEAKTMEPLHSYVLTRSLGREVVVAQMGRARSSNYLVCYGVSERSPLGKIAYGLEQRRSMDLATSVSRQYQREREQELIQEQLL